MGPTTPQQEQATEDVGASPSIAREPVQFPRLELPAVPAFRPPTTPADELPVQRPLLDEPVAAWQSPFPTPEATNTYAFQVVPPPPPAFEPAFAPRHAIPRSAHATSCALPMAHSAQAPAPVPAPAPAQAQAPLAQPAPIPATTTAPARTSVPAMVPATDPAPASDVPATDAPTDVSRVALVLFVVTAAFLVWASRMAFSPALLGLGALLVSELGIALALTGPRGAKRPTAATVAAVGAIVLGLLAAKGALHGFGDMAFVASLFVLAACLPALLLLGGATFVLRRRSPASLADDALRAGTGLRFGAVLAVLATGYLAKDSFSAVPDAAVTIGLVALIAINALHVLRSTGRAARA